MSNIQIVLNKRIDGPTLAAAITDSLPYEIEVVNNYVSGAVVSTIDLASVGSPLADEMMATFDAATWIEEENAIIWKVVKTGKTFNLEGSYVRDTQDTTGLLTALTAGTSVLLRVETPGFETNTVVEISLWYDGVFLDDDQDALKEIGVTISGTGSEFSIFNSVDCKLSLVKPALALEVYVFDFPSAVEIIPMEL